MDSSSSSHGLTSAVYEWGRWKDEYDGPEQGSSSASSSSFTRANVGIRQLTTLSDKHVSMVACGLSHSVALSEYGDVYTWGWAGGHENATYQDSPMPIKRFMLIKALHNVRVKLICASDQHTLALADNGEVYIWGLGGEKEISVPLLPKTVLPLRKISVQLIATGGSHCLALGSDRNLYSWGKGANGRLGTGTTNDCSEPAIVRVVSGRSITQIACGVSHSMCICDNEVYTWGTGGGRLGHPNTDDHLQPTRVAFGSSRLRFTKVSGGFYHSAAISDTGALYTWGWGKLGQLGHGQTADELTPRQVTKLRDVVFTAVACGGFHMAAITDQGDVYTWGQGTSGQLGHGDTSNCSEPKLVEGMLGKPANTVACGWWSTVLVTSEAHTEQEFDAESKLLALQSLHADPTADINQKLTQFNARLLETKCLLESLSNEFDEGGSLDEMLATLDAEYSKESEDDQLVLRANDLDLDGDELDSNPSLQTTLIFEDYGNPDSPQRRMRIARAHSSQMSSSAAPETAPKPEVTSNPSAAAEASSWIAAIKKKLAFKPNAPTDKRTIREDKLKSIWNNEVLPKWGSRRTAARAKELARIGIPDEVRREVWRIAIGNQLQLTSQQFEQLIAIAKDYRQMAESRELAPGSREDKHAKNMMVLDTDLPRTFGQTGMFGRGGPNHQPMQNVLAAFDIYRPDIGYVQGMSYITAMLLLRMDAEQTWIAFCNLTERRFFRSLFKLDVRHILHFVRFFERMLGNALPEVHRHFTVLQIGADIYLPDWLLTIFCKSLPLEVASRVWDSFVLEGEIFIIVAALGILRMLSAQLLASTFEGCLSLLTNLPSDITGDELFAHIAAVRIPDQASRLLNQMLSFW